MSGSSATREWTAAASTVALDARPLALFRMTIAAAGLIAVVGYGAHLSAFFSDEGFFRRADLFEQGVSAYRFCLLDAFGAPWQVFLYWLAMLAALGALFVGWHTRLASVVAWMLVTGFHERTHYPFDGSDLLLRAMLFWAMFADLGRVASIDALRAGRSDREARVPAIPVLVLGLQLLWMYASAALLKLEGPLWRDGTALHYALSAPSSFTRAWATPLADVPLFVRAATWGSIAFEALFPILVIASWRRPRLRALALGSGVAFHLGIDTMMTIGNFPLVVFASYALFLPPRWADPVLAIVSGHVLAPLAARLGPRPERSRPGGRRGWRLTDVALVTLFALVAWSSLATDELPWWPRMPERLRVPVEITSMQQAWDMFAPEPVLGDVWMRGEGVLEDGTHVDVLQDAPGGPISSGRQGALYDRWTKVMGRIAFGTDDEIRPFAQYLCRRWSDASGGARSLSSFELFRVYRRTAPLGEAQPGYDTTVVWTHRCR